MYIHNRYNQDTQKGRIFNGKLLGSNNKTGITKIYDNYKHSINCMNMSSTTITNHFTRYYPWLIILMYVSIHASAQTIFTVATADGYAEGTTGGGTTTPIIVTSRSEFKSAAESGSTAFIVVSGTIDIGSVNVNSNKTILGENTESTLKGNLALSGVSNVIIQNLNITNPSGVGSGDGIEATSGCTKIFVHKCTFIDCADGSFDIKRGSTDITVSWCRFRYPTLLGHNFPNLIGHSDDNGNQDRGKLHVTMHHNWYDDGCQQRMPRVRFGQVHCYNNFYGFSPTDPETDYAIGVGVECSILVENSYFDNINIAWWEWTYSGVQGKIEWRDLCMINTDYPDWAPNSDVFDPPYSYSMDLGCDVKDLVSNSTYGAGNTLTDAEVGIFGVDEGNIFINETLHPNPFDYELTIIVPPDHSFTIRNTQGQVIRQGRGSQIVQTSDLKPGLYLLTITGVNKEHAIFKLLKQ